MQVLVAALLLAPLLAFAPQPKPVSTGGMAVAGGTVAGATGTAMPGATVDLYAWPSDAVQKALRPGQSVPTTLLATATTNSAGKYMLMVPAAKLKAAAVESGYANLEIFSAVGGIWFLSYPAGTLPARPSAPVTVNLRATAGKPLCGKDANGVVYPNTDWIKQRQLHPPSAVVGQGYIVRVKKTAGDYMQFEYNQTTTKSQTSSLGVGISGYGNEAGYNSSGTNTSTATGSEDYPNEAKNSWFLTQFNLGVFRAICYGFGTHVPYQKQHGPCPRKYTNSNGAVFRVHKCLWLIKSTGWFGGGTITHPKATPSAPGVFCAKQDPGTTFKTSKEKAVQWSKGFEIGASTGLKGVKIKVNFSSSAQTGYDSNAVMKFHFKHQGYACGTDKDAANAGIVVMRGSNS